MNASLGTHPSNEQVAISFDAPKNPIKIPISPSTMKKLWIRDLRFHLSMCTPRKKYPSLPHLLLSSTLKTNNQNSSLISKNHSNNDLDLPPALKKGTQFIPSTRYLILYP